MRQGALTKFQFSFFLYFTYHSSRCICKVRGANKGIPLSAGECETLTTSLWKSFYDLKPVRNEVGEWGIGNWGKRKLTCIHFML